MSVVVISGGFDPVHSGHMLLLENAALLGDTLIVGLNSNAWLQRKKGKAFMPYKDRESVLEGMANVTQVLSFDDADNSACDLLQQVKIQYPNDQIIFANGGDRTKENISEMAIDGIEFVFGVGGEHKENSSSWILETWEKQRTVTRWGHYDVLDDKAEQTKVKELVVHPGGCLSYQQHDHRAELWFVKSGTGKVITSGNKHIDHTTDKVLSLKKHQMVTLDVGVWHQLINDSKTEDLNIIEIQYGDKCIEEDIKSE